MKKVISLIICVVLCITLWTNSKQTVTYHFDHDIQKSIVPLEMTFAMPVIADLSDYKTIQSTPSLVEDEDVHINFIPIIEDGYLNALNFFILYETEGYMDCVYGITHNLSSGKFNMQIIEGYKLIDNNLKISTPHLTRIDHKKNVLSQCGWSVTSSIDSPPIQYVYVLQLCAISSYTVPESELPSILEQIQFEMKGYF